MNPDYSHKPGYGKRALSFLIDALICVLLMVALYFTIGEYAISRPLGYQARMDELSALVDESGLADDSGMAYVFPAYEDGEIGASRYGEIVWDYYFNVIPSSSSLRFYGENAYEGDKADKQAVGEWIYREVYGYDGEKIDPRFALPTSFLQMPSYSEEYLSRLEGEDAKEAAEELLAFYYDYGEDGYSGAYVDAFVNFQGQEAYSSLYSYCSKVIYYKGLPSYLGAPLLCFVLLPLCLRGRSVGKLIFRLRVADYGGGKARWYQLLGHYGYIAVCFMLMGLPIGSFMGFVLTCLALLVDFIVLLLSKKRHSLHDMIAHTEVLMLETEEKVAGGGSDELSSSLMQAKEELVGEPAEEGEVPLREKD